jgi:hypothetical protein
MRMVKDEIFPLQGGNRKKKLQGVNQNSFTLQ